MLPSFQTVLEVKVAGRLWGGCARGVRGHLVPQAKVVLKHFQEKTQGQEKEQAAGSSRP